MSDRLDSQNAMAILHGNTRDNYQLIQLYVHITLLRIKEDTELIGKANVS